MASYYASQKDVIARTRETLRYRYMHPTDIWGYESGFKRLDKMTGGIRFKSEETPGESNEMTVVAGRSGVGKSAFGMSVAIHVAQKFKLEYPGLEVRINLLEMEPEQCSKRLVAQIAGLPIYTLQTGRYTAQELRRVNKALDILDDLPIFYMRGAHEVGRIGNFIKGQNKETGLTCGFWMIDHIGLVPTEASKNSNSSFVLGNVSRALHDIAREHAPGYVLAQLNRGSMLRKDPTPTAADLYGSDRIMQDTDNLLLLHRPEMYVESGGEEPEKQPVAEDVTDDEEVAVVIVEKQRDGAAGKRIPMNYLPKYALWADIQSEEYADEPV